MQNGAQLKFFADAMLGKLAKWLRAVGCDTLYLPDIDDAELAERANAEQRVILTRDLLLIKRRLVRGNHFLVHGDAWQTQLRQVVDAFAIDPFRLFLTRCLQCNEQLQTVAKLKVAEKVPLYVFQTQESFKACCGCGRIYWSATHRQQMEAQLKNLFSGSSRGGNNPQM